MHVIKSWMVLVSRVIDEEDNLCFLDHQQKEETGL